MPEVQAYRSSVYMKFLVNPSQPDTSALAFDLENLYIDHISDLQNRTHRNLRAMQQAILLDTKVHKRSKIYHIANGSLELHACYQVFYF